MKFFYILLTFISLQSLAQTRLDSLVLNEINDYRVSKNLTKFQFAIVNFKSALHHSNHLFGTTQVGHTGDDLKTPYDRYSFYGGQSLHLAENVSKVNLNIQDTSQTGLEKIAKRIVESWINSEGHNRILLSEAKFAGVSTLTQFNSVGIKGWSNVSATATLVVSW